MRHRRHQRGGCSSVLEPAPLVLPRRRFLQSAALLAASTLARALPPASRATDGDDRNEPDWEEKLTISVGPKDAQIIGQDDKAIQAALDYARRWGGGTVHLLPGMYRLRNAVFLPSGTRLLGSGLDSVLTKIPGQTVSLADDSDWYDQEITLAKPGDFRVGDGVLLKATNPHHGGPVVIKRTIIAMSGQRFKLDDGLRDNLWLSGKPTCSSLFPLVTSERTSDITIENLALDGDRGNNENLDGNYGGCIFLHDCNQIAIKNVVARNYNGDGISFQICHDVLVENCHCHDNADLGIHPGSGSQRPRLLSNTIERCGIGLFWCWGVKGGLAERNVIDGSGKYGISIGHADTDNLMRENVVRRSGEVGVLFRDESAGRDFWPNRNALERNRIEDSGGPEGIAIDVQGRVKDLRITGNTITESRGAEKRIGIRIGESAGRIDLVDNRFEGLAVAVADARKNSANRSRPSGVRRES